VAVLRERHERVTPARRAVLDVLAGTDHHLNADEIVALAEVRAPGVHRATVYRALATLGDLGVLTHTHVAGSAAVYHLSVPVSGVEAAVPVHGHLQCTVCGAVIDVPGTTLMPLVLTLATDLGFQLQPEHAALLGVCGDCQSDARH
jgi:Fur family ferric uptake transcriptional regulator